MAASLSSSPPGVAPRSVSRVTAIAAMRSATATVVERTAAVRGAQRGVLRVLEDGDRAG